VDSFNAILVAVSMLTFAGVAVSRFRFAAKKEAWLKKGGVPPSALPWAFGLSAPPSCRTSGDAFPRAPAKGCWLSTAGPS
jgi:hypothetical protein